MSSAVIFQIQSGIILALMCLGVYLRRDKQKHMKIMWAVIGWDILLILQIELNRSAIVKASRAMQNAMMLNVHVSIAVLTVIFYFIQMSTGRKLSKNDNSKRSFHKKIGITTLIFRTLTFITSFFAVS